MIVCEKCGKENEDRYKFCLGCGAQLAAPAAPAPRRVSPTPPAGLPKIEPGSIRAMPTTEPVVEPRALSPAPAPAPFGLARASGTPSPSAGRAAPSPAAPAPAVAAAPVGPAPAGAACPECGTPNPPEFVFCGNCGARVKRAGQSTLSIREAKAASVAAAAPSGRMALIRPDGSEGGSFALKRQETIVGRGSGPLFDSDSYLSPRHATLRFEGHQLTLEDGDSLNGVFMKITEEELLHGGDIFRIGQELLRFDEITDPVPLDDGTDLMGSPNPGYRGRLSIIVGPGVDGSAFPLMGEEIVLGRERGDILFSDDGYVSGTHAKIVLSQEQPYLVDLGSSNGTFIKLTAPRTIPSGTFVLMGQQLFRIDYTA